jgi:PhnB protein
MKPNSVTRFAPLLYIPSGIRNVDFYINAFGAEELRRFSNDDGTVHVSELSINGAMFHLHEENAEHGFLEPGKQQHTTVTIGLFVADVDAIMNSALAAGATLVKPAKDYEYGYRQGQVKDPYGHDWQIEMNI